jgi:hypothetical protein
VAISQSLQKDSSKEGGAKKLPIPSNKNVKKL